MAGVYTGLTLKLEADSSAFRKEIKRARRSVAKLNDELRETVGLVNLLRCTECRTEDRSPR